MTDDFWLLETTLSVYQLAELSPRFCFRFQSIGLVLNSSFVFPPFDLLQLQMKLIASVCNISPSIFRRETLGRNPSEESPN